MLVYQEAALSKSLSSDVDVGWEQIAVLGNFSVLIVSAVCVVMDRERGLTTSIWCAFSSDNSLLFQLQLISIVQHEVFDHLRQQGEGLQTKMPYK